MRILIAILLSVCSLSSWAGVETGNGGDVLVCADIGSPYHLKMLDSYEAERYGHKPKWAPLATWQEMVRHRLIEWSGIAPRRIGKYLSWLATFEREARFSDDVTIPDIPDHGSVVLPKGCVPEQVALQRPSDKLYPGVKRYEINNSYWNEMTLEEKAALVLHEIVYREAISYSHANSIPTRYLTGYLMGADVDEIDFINTLKVLPFHFSEYAGLVFNSDKVEFHPNGQVSRIPVTGLSGKSLTIPHMNCDNVTGSFSPSYPGEVQFDELGFLTRFHGIRCASQTFSLEFKDSFGRMWTMEMDKNNSWGGIWSLRRMPNYSEGILDGAGHFFMKSSGSNLYIHGEEGCIFVNWRQFGTACVPDWYSALRSRIGTFLPKHNSTITINGKTYKNLGHYELVEYEVAGGHTVNGVFRFEANGKWWVFNDNLRDWVPQ